MYRRREPQKRATPSRLQEELEAVTWEETSAQEKKILQQLQPVLVEAYRHHLDSSAPAEAEEQLSSGWGWRWSWGAAASVAALLLVWLLPSLWQENISPLQRRGALQTRPTTTTQKNPPLLVEVSPGKSGAIAEKKRWSIEVAGGTSFHLSRRLRRSARLQLQKGRIQVQVQPGTMKRFVVRCSQGFQVVVKGTAFSVEQKKRWLRVEVTRGKVVLQRPRRGSLHLRAGEGIRVGLRSSETVLRYRLPPPHLRDRYQRLSWFARQGARVLFLYVMDLAQSEELPPQQQKALLEQAASILGGQIAYPGKRFALAYRLWMKLYTLNLSGGEAENILYDAAQSCHRAKLAAKHCAALYPLYFRRFPSPKGTPPIHEYFLFHKITYLTRRGAPQPHKALPACRLYLKLYPQGNHQQQVKTILQRLIQRTPPLPPKR